MVTALELRRLVSEGRLFGSLALWSLVWRSSGVGDFRKITPLEK